MLVMDGANLPAGHPVEGSSMKTDVKFKVLQSMKQLHNAKEDLQHQQQKKGGSQHPKYAGRTESNVGIEQFVDSSEGFTGIIKHRWGDFIVHEIDLSGEVIMLTDTSVPSKEEQVKGEVMKPDWFPADIWEKLVKLNAEETCGDSVHVPAGQLSKDQRTQYHGTIKSSFPKLITNTSEAAGEKVIAVRKANATPDKKNTFWKHKPWPKDRPKFLHFCLFKENLDTFVALSNLSMDLKLKSNKFTFAGTKDARAKTTQMVSVKQVTAEKVHEAARKFQKMAVGNFTYKDRELKLGDLNGNQFDLVLRHVQGSDDVISRRIISFESYGFINYYGLQRFGTTNSGTHEVGRAILQRDWRLAVDLLLSGRENEANSMAQAQRAWRADRDPRRALSCLSGKQQRSTIEGRVLHTLSTVRATAYQESVDRLPAGTRQLYVHAYQSWLWNRVVSRRLAKYGLELRPGDLVLAGDQPAAAEEPASDDPAAADAEPADSSEPAGSAEAGAEAANDGSSGRSSFLPRLPDVRVLKESELEAYTIHDLVLPLPGWAIRYPENEMAQWYAELLAADDIELSRERCDAMPQYSVAGAYRHVMARPSAVSWRLLRYSDPNVDLIPSDRDRLRGVRPQTDQPGAPFRALVMQFSLSSSCYATMALREITGTDSSFATQMELNAAYSDEMRLVCAGSAAGETATAATTAVKSGRSPMEGRANASSATKKEGRAAGEETANSAVEEKKVVVEEKEADGGELEKPGAGECLGQKRLAGDGEQNDQKRLKTEEVA